MKLITKKIEKRFSQVWEQLVTENPIVICKLFTPRSYRTWYVTEYYPEAKVCYGYVEWLESERWYFALPEIENLQWPYGLKIERDIHFGECLFSKITLREWR